MVGKRLILIALLGFVVIVVATFIGGRLLTPYAFHGAILQSPQPAHDFALMSHMGQRLALSDLRGKLVLLYFGYTTCPDVCPTTLAELAKAYKLLGKEAEQIQVLMVSVDPDRDTPAVMADYVTSFHPAFIGLIGTPDEIAQIATYYGVYYERVESESALGYLINHTATVTVIDRKGYLRLVFPYGTPAEDIAADLRYLLQR